MLNLIVKNVQLSYFLKQNEIRFLFLFLHLFKNANIKVKLNTN